MKAPEPTDEDLLARIRAICSRFPEAAEGLLQDRPLFHVRRRRFAILNGNRAPYRRRWENFEGSLHLAADPNRGADSRFRESPHHGFRGWIAVDLGLDVDWSEIDRLLESAYRHVASKELIKELDQGAR